MTAPIKLTVKSCTPRCDGGYLVTLRPAGHGVSLEALEEGARVSLTNGRVVSLRLVSR